MNVRNAGLAGLSLLVVAFGYYSATHPVDLPVYYHVGQQVLRHDFNLYPAEIYVGGQPQSSHAFGYAPILAWLFVPMALVSLDVAGFILFSLKVAALAHIVIMVSRLLGIDRRHCLRVGALGGLATAGYLVEEFRNGNVHFLILWLIVVAIYFAERGRVVWPSISLALAIATKITPTLFVFHLALKGRLRIGLYTTISLLTLLWLPVLAVGVWTNATLLKGFVMFAAFKAGEPGNHSLHGLLIRLLTDAPVVGEGSVRMTLSSSTELWSNVYWMAIVLAIVGTLVVLIRHAAMSPLRSMLEYAATTTAILVIAPHAQRIYFSTLFFPCCVLAGLLVLAPASPYRRLIRGTLIAAFSVSSLLPAVLPGRQASLAYERLWPHAFLTLGLFLVTVALAAHTNRLAPAGPQQS